MVPALLAGIGVIGLGAFAYFAAVGSSDVDRLRETCAPRCTESAVDRARTKIIVANVSLAVGALALGSAAVVFFVTPSDRGASAPASGGLVVRGSF